MNANQVHLSAIASAFESIMFRAIQTIETIEPESTEESELLRQLIADMKDICKQHQEFIRWDEGKDFSIPNCLKLT